MIKKMSQFQQRLSISALFIALVILITCLSYTPLFSLFFALGIAASACGALWEYYQIARMKGYHPSTAVGVVCAVGYTLAVFYSIPNDASQTDIDARALWPQAALWLCFLLLFLHSLFSTKANPLPNIAIALFGFVYTVIPLSYLLSINYFPFQDELQDGRWWLLYILAVTKMTDIGGYFIGKSLGKHNLAPVISPKKTIEGSIGGLLFALFTSLLLWSVTPIQMTFWQSIWLGCAICVLAQIGDLAESLLKRDGGIKDSNRLPGLGGLLDIIDSLIFTIPALYLFMKAYQ